ncbi:MAG: hypothetical protein KAS23_11900, partial [Anaerohalosphaera sp.]|nr:hypothetical protein [Anaerohalosphaera sp.]
MRNFSNSSRFLFALLVVCLVSQFVFAEVQSTINYKLISTVEYKGDGEYNNRYETNFRVRKEPLENNQFRYGILADGRSKEMSFTLDKRTMLMSDCSTEFQLQKFISNTCVRSLKRNTTNNINKTWKQSFDLSSLGNSYPSKLSFTLTSQKMNTKKAGDMVVVRALSEPYATATPDGLKGRVNSVCVFDPAIERMYMSVSVVTIESARAGFSKSIVCYQTAVMETDSRGKPIDLGFKEDTKTGKKFSEFVRKIGLKEKMLKVKDKSKMNLPMWAKTDALKVTQLNNLCAGYACEHGVNPVSPVFFMTNQVMSAQVAGSVGSIGLVSVSQTLSASIGTTSLATAPFLGVGVGTASLIGGGGAAAGFSGGGGGG